MKKIIFMCIMMSSFFVAQHVLAATTLTPGDLVIITANGTGTYPSTNGFDFVSRVDITSGTVIYFTDKGWDGSLPTPFWRAGLAEGVVRYTAPALIPAGTVVHFDDSLIAGAPGTWDMFSIDGATGTFGVASGSNVMDFATGGDNLLVFQGTGAAPSFLYGVGWALGTTWISSGTPSSNNSWAPLPLSAGSGTIVSLGTGANKQYKCIASGMYAANFLTSLTTSGNWNSGASVYGTSICTFDTTQPTATIDQSGTQNDPTNNSAITFTLVFSEAINPATFTSGDVVLTGTGTGTVGTPTTSDNITWTIPVTATADGTFIASLAAGTVNDINGNPNFVSTSTDNTVTYDTVAPSAPTTTSVGGDATVPYLTNDNTPDVVFSGITVGDTVTATGYTCTPTPATGTSVTCTATTTLSDGVQSIIPIVTDPAGNSTTGSAVSFTVDTTAPTLVIVSIGGDSTAPYTTFDTTPDIVFTTSINDTVTISGYTCTPTPATGTSVTCTKDAPAYTAGVQSVVPTISDIAGNSTVGSAVSFTVVTTTTTPSSAPDLQNSSDTGSLDTDNITNNVTPVFDVACATVGNTIKLYSNQPSANTLIGTHTCTSSGTEAVTATPLAAGVHSITYTETASPLTESAPSLALSVAIDITSPILSTATPISTPTNDTTPDYTFTTDEVGTITYGGSCGSITTSATIGSNTITLNSLTDGTYSTCTVTVTDRAGNTSTVLTIPSFTIDTTAPTLNLTTGAPATISGLFTITIIPSESISEFTLSDIIITNGIASNLIGSGSGPYTVDITPTANGPFTVLVPFGVAPAGVIDLVGNRQTVDSNIISRTVVLPIVSSSTATSSGGVQYCTETITTFCIPRMIATSQPVPTKAISLGTSGQCSVDLLLTQNMKVGARNGRINNYSRMTLENKEIIREVKILQTHMNRLGFNSGSVDGILGSSTDGAIKRMQKFLGTYQDGLVGPLTRSLINNSCGR